ncbi:unnamed protein product [Kluyveromyces dobzhanskii CBS 2104]|uniref:WGS project CCBQ000000000 data, contig 00106 n=1 Tax=Kluyveromyces dobzhanskii CBS 2104 TaxID=1427455 RepID=A0A0A8L6A7_9SACH|nr:unnamed protein product [Kluyveromyces dobzhanskii CBS 2104]
MASNPPSKCCAQGFYHAGSPTGTISDVYGLETYVTGDESLKSEHVLVILTDVYGIKLNNVLLIADQLAAAGFRVYIPDILFSDEIVSLDGSFDFKSWLDRHNSEKTHGIIQDFLTKLKQDTDPKKIGVIGYCFGGKYALLQINETAGLADAAAIAHPSFVNIGEVEAIGKKPLLISAAETDNLFTAELRQQTVETLIKQGSIYQINLFSGVSHGFAVRGDLNEPQVRYAQDKTIEDQISFFKFYFNCI